MVGGGWRLSAARAVSVCVAGGGHAVAGPPGAPDRLVVMDAGDHRGVRIMWSDSSGAATGFVIERQRRAASGVYGDSVLIYPEAGASAWQDGPGTGSYRYRVAARNGDGGSEFTRWSLVSVTDEWTSPALSGDSRIVCVSSSSGSDGSDGLTQLTPKKTIEAGYALLRDGFPDRLLLKRGDTWSVGELMTWTKSGRSASEPMLVGSYGESGERPTIVSTGETALPIGAVNFLAVTGLHFVHDRSRSASNAGSNAIARVERGEWFLIEDCLLEHYGKFAIVVQAGAGSSVTDVTIRRNVVYDTYDGGVYVHGAYGFLFEENVLDTIGLARAAADPENVVAPQALYVQTSCRNVTVRGNIFSNVASSGVQLRPGGDCHDNLFVRNAMAINLGSTYEGNAPSWSNACRNVVLDGKDISAKLPRGWGICLQNFAGGTLSENIIANKASTREGFAVNLGSDAPVNNAVFEGTIIYGWRGNILVSEARHRGNEFKRTTIWDMDGEDRVIEHTGRMSLDGVRYRENRYWSAGPPGHWFEVGGATYPFREWAGVADDAGSVVPGSGERPWRRARPPSVGAYNAGLGGEDSHEAFMGEVRRQSRLNWRAGYTARGVIAYIRGGFGLAP